MNRRLETESNRANTAYRCAKQGIDNYGEKYESIVGKLPMQILNNGLGESIAFHFSKCKKLKTDGTYNAHWYVCEQLRKWLVDQHYLCSLNTAAFALEVVSLSVADSRMVTNEMLAFLSWLRRFTDGLAVQQAALTGNTEPNESSNGSTALS